MRFLDPMGWWWAAAIAVPVVLYLVRPRPRRLRVASIAFFLGAAGAAADAPWLQRLKRLLSFLLTVLVLAAAAACLARPVAAPPADGLRSVVLLVDRSASMGARDGGRPRLEAALAAARARCDALAPGASVAVVAYDRRAGIVLPRTTDRRAVAGALAGLAPRPIAAGDEDRAEALALAGRLAAVEVPAAVWEVTDRADAEPGWVPAEVAYARVAAGAPGAVNVGIAACDARPLPLDPAHQELFLLVVASGAASATVEIALDGAPIALRTIEFTADHDEERIVLPLPAAGGALDVSVSAPGDVLAADDRVSLTLPAPRPLEVALVGPAPDPFLQLALAGLDASQVRVMPVKPDAWREDLPADVLLFAGWLPPRWPAGRAVVIADPPAALPPLHVAVLAEAVPVAGPRTADASHPVLYGVAAPRVTVSQQAVLGADAGLAPLWSSTAGPMLMAGEVGGARAVAMALSPSRSERLALLASWPLLIGNSLLWAGQPTREAATGHRVRSGTALALRGTRIRWQDGTVAPLRGGWAELDRLGRWESDGGDTGSSALLDAAESRLGAAPRADGAAAGGARLLSGDLIPLLAALALAALLAEAWLCHRKGIA